jgi:peptide/nickel transport system permease protein
MLRFAARRTAACIVQLLGISLIAYVLFFVVASLTGADPAQRAAGRAATPAQVRVAAHVLGTDRPWYAQYGHFVWRLLHGDLGYSFAQRRPVTDIVLPAAGVTAQLVAGAVVVWLLIAIPVGVAGALKPRSVRDRSLMVPVLVGISAPVFWVAPMLAYAFAYQPTQGRLLGVGLPFHAEIFPIQGYVPFRDDPVAWLHHMILPWLALALGFAALYARLVRALAIEQLGEDYVRTAVAKGAPQRRILRSHVGRNVAPLVVTALGLDVGVALGGALFVEQVFGLPGLGYVGLSSIENLDYPLTVGVVLFAAFAAVVANTVVDLITAALDPRVRLGSGA